MSGRQLLQRNSSAVKQPAEEIKVLGVSPSGTYLLVLVNSDYLCKKYLPNAVLPQLKPMVEGTFFCKQPRYYEKPSLNLDEQGQVVQKDSVKSKRFFRQTAQNLIEQY